MSILHEVTASGDIDKLEDLLSQSRINKNEKDEDWDGRTPLLWATIEGHLSCVKLLLESGANPNVQNNDDKTVAHYAAESGRCDVLKAIIEYGCDVNIKDKFGDTAMDYALLYGQLECAALINKALKGEFNYKVRPEYWSASPSPPVAPAKSHRHDVRRSKTLFSLLSGLKNLGGAHGHQSPEGKRTPTNRRKKQSGTSKLK